MTSVPHPSEAPHGRAGLSCISCRRRKVKCDRQLPRCDICNNISATCSYPTEARKPGPKIGSSTAPRKRRRQPGDENDTIRHDAPDSLARRSTASSSGTLTELVRSSADADKTFAGLHELPSILHPSHESIPTPSFSAIGNSVEGAIHDEAPSSEVVYLEAYRSLGVSPSTASILIDVYLSHVTIFSLFHKPSFRSDLLRITSHTQLTALLAAMFALSARFVTEDSTITNINHLLPPPSHFQAIAVKMQEASLHELGDRIPPLCLVQAFILTTFQHLICGVRGIAWRYLGTCIRLAYEIGLHQVDPDSSSSNSQGTDAEETIRKEEKRRAWWAVWEMDTFASTIRRLPTGIDGSLNETYLPIPDERWYNGHKQDSCYLYLKPIDRWRCLQKSGNEACKAWFIVINSLMRDAQVLSDPKGRFLYQKRGEQPRCQKNTENERQTMERLDIICNSISCINVALPKSLQYHGENLTFTSLDPAQAAFDRQFDGAKLGIHVMIQLTRIMVGHFRAFHFSMSDSQSPQASQKQALNNFVSGADNIFTVISRSAENHMQHVSPFFASYIWVAAATFLMQKYLGDSTVNTELVESKYELLKINHKQYVDFWGTPSVLEQRLEHLERYFEKLESCNEREKISDEGIAERITEASTTQSLLPMVSPEVDPRQTPAFSHEVGSSPYTPESISGSQYSSYPLDGALNLMPMENYNIELDFNLPPLLDGELNMPLFLDNLFYGSYSP